MNKARKLATDMAVSFIEKIAPKSGSSELIRARLEAMSDRAFDNLMKDLRDKKTTLSIKFPNLSKSKISVKNNIKIGKELGYDFFQHLHLRDPATGLEYVTPKKYMVLRLPFRRQSQHLYKKLSVPLDNDTRDDLTGQPTGKSKGSSLSNPEMQVLYSLGLDNTIEELLKSRGGDVDAYTAMNKSIHETGGFSLRQVEKSGGKVKATETLAAFYRAQGIENNF